jgi:hypothetical protein
MASGVPFPLANNWRRIDAQLLGMPTSASRRSYLLWPLPLIYMKVVELRLPCIARMDASHPLPAGIRLDCPSLQLAAWAVQFARAGPSHRPTLRQPGCGMCSALDGAHRPATASCAVTRETNEDGRDAQMGLEVGELSTHTHEPWRLRL